jgi:hypothetical protein
MAFIGKPHSDYKCHGSAAREQLNNDYFLTGRPSPITKAAREQRVIDADKQFPKASYQPRDWWAREAECEGFDWDGVLSLALEIAAMIMESSFERACRLAGQQHKQPAPVKSKPHRDIAPKGPSQHPTKLRLRAFWREVMAAREANRSAEIEADLLQTARECGLVADVHKLGGHGEEDIRHVSKWGLRGLDPWGQEFPNAV